MNDLKQALNPVVSFNIVNTNSTSTKKLCLLPGHFNTEEIVMVDNSGTAEAKLSYADPTRLTDAGYACDQVADDTLALVKSTKNYALQITPGSPRTHYRDFLDYISRVGSKITKIRITNNTGNASGRAQFDKEMQVSASMLGSTAGSDYINLASCKNPANYDQDMIVIDLSERNLVFDATTLLFLTIVPNANFTIEFTLDK